MKPDVTSSKMQRKIDDFMIIGGKMMGKSMEVHYLHSSVIFPAINLHLVRGISQPRLFTGGYVQLLSHYYSKWTIPQPYWEIQISEMGLQTGYPMIISYLYLYISIYIWLVVSNMFFSITNGIVLPID